MGWGKKKKDQLLRAPSSVGGERLAAVVGTIRRESTREENADSSREKNTKVRTVVGRGNEGPLGDPGSDLLLLGGSARRVLRK